MRRTDSGIATSPATLAGATVIVTRPSATAATLKRRIAALGGIALGLPGVGLRAAEDSGNARAALNDARKAELAVFNSPAAVGYAFKLLPTLRFARAARVCAVGAGTAHALQRRGVHHVLWPAQRQDSEGLLALAEFARLRGRRIALIGAPGGRDLLPAALRERGALVQSIHVYKRAVPRLTRRHFAALEQAAPPLLTLLSSAEALGNLRARLPAPLFARLVAGDAIVSSLRLAQAARSAGFARVHVARSATSTDMLVGAARALAHHRL